MAHALGLTLLGTVPAADWPAWTAGLLEAGQPRLAVARLSGGVIALGRYQRSGTVLSPHGQAARVVRRMTGGRAIALGDGLCAIALALPHRSWLAGDDLAAIPAARFVNRAVRGVLSGLGNLGCSATYFGRDYVTAAGGQAAYVSFEIDAEGHALLECILGVESHWWLPAECDSFPSRSPPPGVPGPASVLALAGVDTGRLLVALGGGYAERFGVTVFSDDSPLAPVAERPPDLSLPRWSSLQAVPIGFVEAGLEVAERRVIRAALCGDMIADSAGVRAVEAALPGSELMLESLGARLNSVYSDAAHTMTGINDLTVWMKALLEAGGAS